MDDAVSFYNTVALLGGTDGGQESFGQWRVVWVAADELDEAVKFSSTVALLEGFDTDQGTLSSQRYTTPLFSNKTTHSKYLENPEQRDALHA